MSLYPRSIRRALEAMRLEPAREWSLATLAETAGVSRRTLQRQFQIFVGQSPQRALRDIRFEAARRALLQGAPDRKVMDVALSSGFAHFGRFATEYRRRYGEAPSQTRQRQGRLAELIGEPAPIIPSARQRPSIFIQPDDETAGSATILRHFVDELTVGLQRAGTAVVRQIHDGQYRLALRLQQPANGQTLVVRLIDAGSGNHLWAQRFDGPVTSLDACEPLLATRIVAAIQPALRVSEIEKAYHKADGELRSSDLVLRAIPGVLSLDRDGNTRAVELLERARSLQPDDALAAALAAWAHGQRIVYHFTSDPSDDRARGIALASRAQSGPTDATTLAVLSSALTLFKDIAGAEHLVGRALQLDGSSAWAWSRSGWVDLYKADARSAIERFMIALDLAPNDPLAFNSMVGIGCAHFEAGRYAEAAAWQERALREHPSSRWIHRTLCPAYVLSGNKIEARRSLHALRQTYPDLTMADLQLGLPPLPQFYCDLLLDALSSVGLPS